MLVLWSVGQPGVAWGWYFDGTVDTALETGSQTLWRLDVIECPGQWALKAGWFQGGLGGVRWKAAFITGTTGWKVCVGDGWRPAGV